MTKKKIVVVNIANEENDDWLKKAFPERRKEELELHRQLSQDRKKAKDAS